MMKSLSRLFGGKNAGAKAAGERSSDAKEAVRPMPSPKVTAALKPKPAAPVPSRPVEVRAPDAPKPVKPKRATPAPAAAATVAPASAPSADRDIELDGAIGTPLRVEPGKPATPIVEPVTNDPDEPEVVDYRDAEDDDSDAPDTATSLSTRKGKAEMLNQLRKNYDEVLGIVRKVDQHLDDQARRSERMLEIAERTAKHLEKLEHLGELTEQQRHMADTMSELVNVTKQGHAAAATTGVELMKAASDQLEQQRTQTDALREVKESVDRAGDSDQAMADSIKGFTDTIGGVETATHELGRTITTMRENDAERERELAQIVSRSQRWLIVTVVTVGVVAIGALAAVLMAAF